MKEYQNILLAAEALASGKLNSTCTCSKDFGTKECKEFKIPPMTLPKGGKALRGVDEKISINAVNGTSAFSIAVPISLARNFFEPSTPISYNSQAGNGIFTSGLNVDISIIKRKTKNNYSVISKRKDQPSLCQERNALISLSRSSVIIHKK